jgi:endoglucanase
MHLEQLSNAFGVSGAEHEVRQIIFDAVKPYIDEWRVDTMGNLFVTRRHRVDGIERPLKVMVSAHMDEVGFIISKITSAGQLKFKTIGGFDPRVLLGKAVVVGQKEQVPGVIGLKPIHLLKKDWRKVPTVDAMYIDIGANNDSPREASVGDLATFATRFGYLDMAADKRENEGRVKGKALDNRAGCALLIELLRRDYPVDLIAVFTVQEEIGLRGARVAAYTVAPDIALILECTAADDLPRLDEDADEGIPRLGLGPAITVMDRSFIADRRLVDLLFDTARQEDIPVQFKRPGIGGTDAGAIHLAHEGVPAGVLSVPARFIHSPAAVLDLADFWNAEKLVASTLGQLPQENW